MADEARISRMGALHRRGVGERKVVEMLKRVEGNEMGELAESGRDAEWPHREWVRVDSKSQAPYKFYPCFNPCVPQEWPYDLQALRGTEDWDDVIRWFLERHPKLLAEDVDDFVLTLESCVRGRAISVEVSNDPELAFLGLWFRVWGFDDHIAGFESDEIRAMNRISRAVPAFRRMRGDIGIDIGHGRFEDRNAPREY